MVFTRHLGHRELNDGSWLSERALWYICPWSSQRPARSLEKVDRAFSFVIKIARDSQAILIYNLSVTKQLQRRPIRRQGYRPER